MERKPVARVRPVAERAPEITYLRPEDIDELLAMFQGNALDGAVATSVCAGLRRDELIWLRGQDVDIERHIGRVVAKTVEGGAWQSKTRRNRQAPISSRLAGVLERVGIGSRWVFRVDIRFVRLLDLCWTQGTSPRRCCLSSGTWPIS